MTYEYLQWVSFSEKGTEFGVHRLRIWVLDILVINRVASDKQ